MSVRKPLLFAVALFALTAAGPSAQESTRAAQTFRSGVDVITVDVTAVDRQGRPVTDLRPGDFAVKVDGKNRPVISAQLIKSDSARVAVEARQLSGDPADVLISSNAGGGSGTPASLPVAARHVAVVVDQTLITPGAIQTVMRTGAKFVDALTPPDFIAVLAIPEPGPRVEFTTDKARAHAALERIVGQPAKQMGGIFDMSQAEALQIDRAERSLYNLLSPEGGVPSFEAIWANLGETSRRVIGRGCKELTLAELAMPEHASDLVQCLQALQRESALEAQQARADASIALRRLESYFKELGALEGQKSMVLVSGGLLVLDEAQLLSVTQAAADARVIVNVVAVDHEREREYRSTPNEVIGGGGSTAGTRTFSPSNGQLQDRALELQGLDTIAERTGGTRYNAIGPAEGVFDRIALELSASYLVAVERRPGDPERQRIDVGVKRKGVTVRAPKTVVGSAATAARRSMEDVLNAALGSPLPIAELPLRVSTFARRDPSGAAYLVNVAAEVGQPDTLSGEFAVGYTVIDQQEHVVLARGTRTRLGAVGTRGPLPYDAAVTLPPGVYSVRVGVVDGDKRRGTVVRRLELPALTGETLATSDLIVGPLATGDTMHPQVEPHVAGRLGAYLELYVPEAEPGRVSVQLDIAEGAASPALSTVTLNIAAGARPNWRVASGAIDSSLLPGRYLARATVRRDGTVIRTVSRPFVLERPSTSGPVVRATAAALAPEVRARTASYVSAFVRGLSNVVGQEDFEIGGRKVASEFLLVQYPGAAGDFLTYRDVMQVNGTPVADRDARLADLFLKPPSLVRDQVRRITLASEQQVPSILNPIFVLAFLQSDFQQRFELTVTDAGREWPAGVQSVSFVETARPTILRGGLAGDLDVPVRGTAWLEPATGRVLQTALLIPNGRATTTVTTTFRLDQRLQIMVPDQMRTQNPNGTAVYSNFRRFSVSTETAIPPPAP